MTSIEAEQNLFYTSISKHYSDIFPYNPAQLKFVENNLKELSGKNILDIGCATGELALRLAQKGCTVEGIDLNSDLLTQAHSKNTHSNVHFQEGNMLFLPELFSAKKFDSVLCFGNTIVHLESIKLVQQMLEGAYSVLKPAGVLMLQLLNYDFILKEKVDALPLIETGNIKFIRNYKFIEGSDFLAFNTELFLKNEQKTISNETKLLPLRSSRLKQLLEAAGFTSIQFFSDFKQSPFGGNHILFIVRCLKSV